MELSEGAACALVAEEAMIRGNMDQLAAWVRTQPAWSDFPIVLLTGRGDSPERPIFATQVSSHNAHQHYTFSSAIAPPSI